jgi:hypothetical protein
MLRMALYPGLVVALPVAALLVACDKKPSGQPNSGASSSASVTAASMSPPPASALVEKIEVPLCRVIAVRPKKGAPADASSGARAPAVGTAFDGRDFLDLGDETEVALRHGTTTRELTLRGPGRFLPCFLGTETVLIATGTVKTTAGAGARAGAEVILATPLGALHFADAALEVRVGEREFDARVDTGGATLVLASGRKNVADGGTPDLVLGPKGRKRLSGAVAAADLVSRCRETAGALGASPPAPAPSASSSRTHLGQWSVAQLKARQDTRWACAIARAAVGRLDGPERDRLWAEITASDPIWKALP